MSEPDCAYADMEHLTFGCSSQFPSFVQNYLDCHHLFFNRMGSLHKTTNCSSKLNIRRVHLVKHRFAPSHVSLPLLPPNASTASLPPARSHQASRKARAPAPTAPQIAISCGQISQLTEPT